MLVLRSSHATASSVRSHLSPRSSHTSRNGCVVSPTGSGRHFGLSVSWAIRPSTISVLPYGTKLSTTILSGKFFNGNLAGALFGADCWAVSPPAFWSNDQIAEEGSPTVRNAMFAQTTSASVELILIDVCFLLKADNGKSVFGPANARNVPVYSYCHALQHDLHLQTTIVCIDLLDHLCRIGASHQVLN